MQIKKNYIIAFILLTSCGIRSVSYKKAKSLDLSKGYKTILNNETKIELEKYYLDVENISNITVFRKTKTLNIFQFNKNPKSFNLTEIQSLEFKKRYRINKQDSISLIVINGIPVKKNEWKNYQIEHSAIKSLNVVKDANATVLNCNGKGGKNILIILTK